MFASFLARKMGMDTEEIKRQALIHRSLPPNEDGSPALPVGAGGKGGFRAQFKEQLAARSKVGQMMRKQRDEAEVPRADGTFKELTFIQKLTPVSRAPYKQKQFKDIMSQRSEYIVISSYLLAVKARSGREGGKKGAARRSFASSSTLLLSFSSLRSLSLFSRPSLTLIFSFLLASYILQFIIISGIWLCGVLYPPDFGKLLSPRPAPAGPSAESTAGKRVVKETETSLQELEVVKAYRKQVGWYECREY